MKSDNDLISASLGGIDIHCPKGAPLSEANTTCLRQQATTHGEAVPL